MCLSDTLKNNFYSGYSFWHYRCDTVLSFRWTPTFRKKMLSSFLASTSDNEDSLFCPGIGVERPTRCHTSDVYSAKNYGFANFI